MTPNLRLESEKLTQCWMRHEPGTLRDYLVADVEDPRINLQSIFSRHWILERCSGDRFAALMNEEQRFSAAMNALLALFEKLHHPEEAELILYALGQQSDNAEGIEIPHLILDAFKALPVDLCGVTVPNYVATALREGQFQEGKLHLPPATLDTFAALWSSVLASAATNAGSEAQNRPTVLEPACGSANDYRFLHRYGITELIDYTGFDLCAHNVENARAMNPQARFIEGNVFQIAAADRAYDMCFVHDLFEHLSIEGLQTAVGEITRVTRESICAHFFNMDEIPEHQVRPVENYHWNTLSLGRVRDLFHTHGFESQALHIGTFVRRRLNSEGTHNPNAYTLIAKRRPAQ